MPQGEDALPASRESGADSLPGASRGAEEMAPPIFVALVWGRALAKVWRYTDSLRVCPR